MNQTQGPILLLVGGSVAAYKALELCRRLMEAGHSVQAVLSEAARQFVAPLSFQALTGREVKTDLFDLGQEAKIGHIDLARKAKLVLVAPATANSMAKAAHGLADDYGSTLLLATKTPVIWAPAMNWAMWANEATQANRALLESRGHVFVGPDSGDLACGEEGAGRLAETGAILAAVETNLNLERPLSGKKVLITAGPTREKIDAVRYVSNYSSGKMGYALAAAAQELGAQVTLVSGPVALGCPPGVERVWIESAEEMREAVLERFEAAQLIVKCAAVGDYRAKEVGSEKLKKAEDFSVQFTLNRDILAELGQKRRVDQLLVGFAAETGDLRHWAESKLKRKGADWIVANDVSLPDAGFDKDQNRVLVVGPESNYELGPMAKTALARELMARWAKDPKLNNP